MNKVVSAFPRMSIQKDNLRIIKLSYQKYADQSKGRHDVSNRILYFKPTETIEEILCFFLSAVHHCCQLFM